MCVCARVSSGRYRSYCSCAVRTRNSEWRRRVITAAVRRAVVVVVVVGGGRRYEEEK